MSTRALVALFAGPAAGPAADLAAGLAPASFAAPAALAEAPDWNAVADVEQIEVLTQNEDGSRRETTIWLIVVDGEAHIRTGNTRWGGNVVRNPELFLRIQGTEYPLRAEFVEDDAERELIVAAFREKYGWFDGFMNVFRGARPRIMRMVER